ncbi:MAG: polyphosphate kinase 1 [Marinilabiliaceae bacterium]|nr:polyphosphate kinase 1 [Marinilabiliaceae bacterium]
MSDERGFAYFNRDVSWLAFNYRVLEEARSCDLPLYERMRFLSIYSSNLIEFYSVRVAEYREASSSKSIIEDVEDPQKTLRQINSIVSRQIEEVTNIMREQIRPSLETLGVHLYMGDLPQSPLHRLFMADYFQRELIPYLQPLVLSKATRIFLRNNRPYFAIKMFSKEGVNETHQPTYALVKLPVNDLPRFVQLPDIGDGVRHVVFLDDIIRSGLHELFPGYDIDGIWSMKVARDAALGLLDKAGQELVEVVRHSAAQRNTGIESSFYIDRSIAPDLLHYLEETFSFSAAEAVMAGRYLSLNQLDQFPQVLIPGETLPERVSLRPAALKDASSMFDAIDERDHIIHYPYQSFDYVIRFLSEAAIDPSVEEIKVTQYRVASNSAVVNSLIAAAHNHKHVTVFVELKARFDERNNLALGELMEQAGIKVIYSIVGVKVHAKMALVIRKGQDGNRKAYTYLSTGNFNEKTAKQYTDHGLFTADNDINDEIIQLFDYLEDQRKHPQLRQLLVARLNLIDELYRLIDGETAKAKRGEEGYILLKMNGMQNHKLIDKLYEASLAGVKIDLILRGICCLVPEQEYSRNITIRRIVDRYLEHGRIWVFGKGDNAAMYLTSSDWLNRNIERRIELAFPIKDHEIRQEIMHILQLQLADNVKARIIDRHLMGHIPPRNGEEDIRAQERIFDELGQKVRWAQSI